MFLHTLRHALDARPRQPTQLCLLVRFVVNWLRLATLQRPYAFVMHLLQFDLAHMSEVAVIISPHLGCHVRVVWLFKLCNVGERESVGCIFLGALVLLLVLGKVRRPAHLAEVSKALRFGLRVSRLTFTISELSDRFHLLGPNS